MYSALILIAAGFIAAEQRPGSAGSDDKLIQGKWDYVSVRCDGQPFPLEKGDYILISGRNWSIHRNRMVIKAEHTLDPSKNPKHLDLVVERDGEMFRLKEIYKLEQNGLTLCEPPRPEAPRPTAFSAEKGEKQFLIVLKRSISAEEPETAAAGKVRALIVQFRDKDAAVRRKAALAAGELGEAAVPALMRALKDQNTYVSTSAAIALRGIGVAAVPPLVEALKDEHVGVRRSAVATLGLIGPRAKDAVPALIIALSDKDDFVRYNSAVALGAFGLEAELVGCEDNVALLKKRDGTLLGVPLDKLSEQDRQWIRQARK